MTQMDLILYLIRQQVGRELAMSYLLIDSRCTQARYQVWGYVALTDDETARNFEALIEVNLPDILAERKARSNCIGRRRPWRAAGPRPLERHPWP